MTKHKLKLKRTPEEEAEHQARKDRRRERKRKREQSHYASSSKRFHSAGRPESPNRKWASSDEDDEEYGPQPASAASPPTNLDYDALKAEIEERMFREKMFDALGDDDRLDGIESRFNDFAHVPEHLRHGSAAGLGKGKTKEHVYEGDEFLKMDPGTMDDEEYAEWVRMGMYRKTHAEEYAEQQRKKAAHEARKAEEKARKAETKRLEKQAEEERKQRRAERDVHKFEEAREEYNLRWTSLLAAKGDAVELAFGDIPWPVVAAYRRRRRPENKEDAFRVGDLSEEAISLFLFPVLGPDKEAEEKKKDRKDRLREAILRFHPDKFEGRFLSRVRKEDQDLVKEAIGQVSRALNSLNK